MDVFKLIEKHGIELHGDIEYFAHLVAEAEREACAEICDELVSHTQNTKNEEAMFAAMACAETIRARGEK